MIMICGIFSFFLFDIRYELYISLEYLNEGAIKYLPIYFQLNCLQLVYH